MVAPVSALETENKTFKRKLHTDWRNPCRELDINLETNIKELPNHMCI